MLWSFCRCELVLYIRNAHTIIKVQIYTFFSEKVKLNCDFYLFLSFFIAFAFKIVQILLEEWGYLQNTTISNIEVAMNKKIIF